MKDTVISLTNGIYEARTGMQRMLEMMNGYEDTQKLEAMNVEDLDDMLHRLEKTALSVRYAIWSRKHDAGCIFQNRNRGFNRMAVSEQYGTLYDFGIQILFADGTLKVISPITHKRYSAKNISRNYDLNAYIQSSLITWAEAHKEQVQDFAVQRPFAVVVTRYVVNPGARDVCDNDNAENGRTINSIFSVLKGSDNGLVLDCISRVRACRTPEETRTEFWVIPRERLSEHIRELIA